MANIFKMMKQVSSMRSEMKQIEKTLAQKKVDYSTGGVTVVAKGDMSIESIKLGPDAIDPSRLDRLEKSLTNAVNGALGNAKKLAGSEVTKLAGDMGIGDLLGE